MRWTNRPWFYLGRNLDPRQRLLLFYHLHLPQPQHQTSVPCGNVGITVGAKFLPFFHLSNWISAVDRILKQMEAERGASADASKGNGEKIVLVPTPLMLLAPENLPAPTPGDFNLARKLFSKMALPTRGSPKNSTAGSVIPLTNISGVPSTTPKIG